MALAHLRGRKENVAGCVFVNVCACEIVRLDVQLRIKVQFIILVILMTFDMFKCGRYPQLIKTMVNRFELVPLSNRAVVGDSLQCIELPTIIKNIAFASGSGINKR